MSRQVAQTIGITRTRSRSRQTTEVVSKAAAADFIHRETQRDSNYLQIARIHKVVRYGQETRGDLVHKQNRKRRAKSRITAAAYEMRLRLRQLREIYMEI